MTDIEKEKADEFKLQREEKDCDDHDDDDIIIERSNSNTNFLPEMNLLITVLSLALSSEDCINSSENEVKIPKEAEEAKARVSEINSRRREVKKDLKSLERRAQRFQPSKKDCRHGRKM